MAKSADFFVATDKQRKSGDVVLGSGSFPGDAEAW